MTAIRTVRRIGLLGNFGSVSLGNEASLSAGLDMVRTSFGEDVDVECICNLPIDAAALHGVPTRSLRGRRWPHGREWYRYIRFVLRPAWAVADLYRAVRLARTYDLIMVPGTGIVDDYCDTPSGIPYDLARWSLATRLARRPFWLVSVGAGPIEAAMSRRLFSLATRLARKRSFRDEDSRHVVASLGVDVSRDPIVPDMVFGHPCLLFNDPSSQATGNAVGFGVMVYRGWDGNSEAVYRDYLARSVRIVEGLVRSGRTVMLFSTELTDAAAIDTLFRRLDPIVAQSVSIAPMPSTLDVLAEELRGLDVIVAPRYHALVLALTLGIPAVGLSYAPKNVELLRSVGLGEYCHAIDDEDCEAIIASVDELESNRAMHSGRIRNHVAEFRREIRSHVACGLAEFGGQPL